MENSNIHSLNQCRVHKQRAILNRLHIFLHILALAAIFCYRGSYFLDRTESRYQKVPILPWLAIFGAEFMIAFIWALRQPCYWRPVTRTVFPERLPEDERLPGIDVFICTADPNREPTVNVMNTVISAMALDYPAQKLSVYLSDDAGASVTLDGLRAAWVFATWWLPFCRRYNVKPPCPQAYFDQAVEDSPSVMFIEDRKLVQEKYEIFKQRVRNRRDRSDGLNGDAKNYSRNHPAFVQIIDGSNAGDDAESLNPEPVKMPLLVYVAREKNPSYPHNFKAGALNVLIYFPGADGLHGPLITGTNVYIKRDALYGIDTGNVNDAGNDLMELRKSFGPSSELLSSLTGKDNRSFINSRNFPSVSLPEAHLLASCSFEKDTQWGKKIGFWYDTVVEDVMTGIYLHSKGWRSVYMNPERPQFLGSATTNFDDMFTQGTRWFSGFVDIVLSKHCPLICRPSKLRFHEKMLSSYFFFEPFYCLPILCYAIIPPICFLFGVPLYPQASNPFFLAFAYTLLSSWLKHLSDVLISGGSVTVWLNELRVWIIRSMTSFLFGSLDYITTRLGFREASFNPTNKADDDDKTKWYQLGKYDFRISTICILPLLTTVNLNLLCAVIGVVRLVVTRDLNSMLVHTIFSFYAVLLSLPVIDGMLLRKDNGRVPSSTTLMSTGLSLVFLSFGYVFMTV